MQALLVIAEDWSYLEAGGWVNIVELHNGAVLLQGIQNRCHVRQLHQVVCLTKYVMHHVLNDGGIVVWLLLVLLLMVLTVMVMLLLMVMVLLKCRCRDGLLMLLLLLRRVMVMMMMAMAMC